MPSMHFTLRPKSISDGKITMGFEVRGQDLSDQDYEKELFTFEIPESKGFDFDLFSAKVHLGVRAGEVEGGKIKGDYDGHVDFGGARVMEIPKAEFST